VNSVVIINVGVAFVLFLLCVIPSLLLAQRKNAELFARDPGAMPYAWGFFLGYSGIFVGALAILAGLALILAGFYRDWFPIALAYAAATGIASYGVLTRRRWGWVLHIPLSLNMGFWVFNSAYVFNRWREL